MDQKPQQHRPQNDFLQHDARLYALEQRIKVLEADQTRQFKKMGKPHFDLMPVLFGVAAIAAVCMMIWALTHKAH